MNWKTILCPSPIYTSAYWQESLEAAWFNLPRHALGGDARPLLLPRPWGGREGGRQGRVGNDQRETYPCYFSTIVIPGDCQQAGWLRCSSCKGAKVECGGEELAGGAALVTLVRWWRSSTCFPGNTLHNKNLCGTDDPKDIHSVSFSVLIYIVSMFLCFNMLVF